MCALRFEGPNLDDLCRQRWGGGPVRALGKKNPGPQTARYVCSARRRPRRLRDGDTDDLRAAMVIGRAKPWQDQCLVTRRA